MFNPLKRGKKRKINQGFAFRFSGQVTLPNTSCNTFNNTNCNPPNFIIYFKELHD